MTDPLGQSQVIPYIQELSKEGYKFTLLSCEKRDRFDKHKDMIYAILREANIDWQPILYHKSPPVLSTIYDYLKLRKRSLDLHKNKRFDLIHCRSYISSLIGLHFKEKLGVPFIFDMRGFWADERVDGGLWNLKNPVYNLVYRFFKKKENEFLLNCAAAVSLTEAGKAEMDKWEVSKKHTLPLHVIPCSADFNLFLPVEEDEKNKVKANLSIDQNAFVLSYLGSIGTWYLLDEMLDFFKELLQQYPNAVFLFITPDNPEFIKTHATAKKIPLQKIYVFFALRKEVAGITSISDLSIFFIKPCFSKISSSPTKLGELLAMGIPVICNNGIGDVKDIVKFTNGGFSVDSFSQQSYKEVIEKIKDLKNINKEEMRSKAMEYYSLEKGAKKYSFIYRSIFKIKN